jgi:hypothetical protein
MSVVIKVENTDMVTYLSDHVTDDVELQGLFPEIPMELLKGNTDRNDECLSEKTLLLSNKRIFITMGIVRYRTRNF